MNFFKTLIFTFTLIGLVGAQAYAQNSGTNSDDDFEIFKEKKFDKCKIRPGFSGGLGLSGSYFSVSMAPQVGYKIIEQIEVGVGLSYDYQNLNGQIGVPQQSHLIGGKLYQRIYVFEELFLQIEETLVHGRVKSKQLGIPPITGVAPNIFVGGGYNFQVGGGTYMSLQLMFNLLTDEDSNSELTFYPRRWPVYRVGFVFDLCD